MEGFESRLKRSDKVSKQLRRNTTSRCRCKRPRLDARDSTASCAGHGAMGPNTLPKLLCGVMCTCILRSRGAGAAVAAVRASGRACRFQRLCKHAVDSLLLLPALCLPPLQFEHLLIFRHVPCNEKAGAEVFVPHRLASCLFRVYFSRLLHTAHWNT